MLKVHTEMYVAFCVQFLLILSNFNQTWNGSTDFVKLCCVVLKLLCVDRWTDVQTDQTS
jgi:hypothetical protein